jgi:hypothetical protein
VIALARALLVACAAGGENRLWFVDLELSGPCEELRLDCGADGETLVRGPFASGEDRRASVPVPVRSPLGVEGLSSLPLPRVRAVPEEAASAVRVLGWSEWQPAPELERDAGALLFRPRPPLAPARPRAGWPELLLVGIAGGFLLRLRHRPAVSLALALGAGLAAVELARSRTAALHAERLLEWETGGALALSVTVARDELALPREWLEIAPEGARLEFVLPNLGCGSARASGARLAAVERAPVPPLAARENGGEPLAEVWTRSAGGEWLARGSWPRGEPLGGPTQGDRRDPPGWLASALSPGRGALLARTAAGTWLRCLGFPPE